MLKSKLIILKILLITLLATGCSQTKSNSKASKPRSTQARQSYDDHNYPKTREQKQLERIGKIGGGEGLLNRMLGLNKLPENKDPSGNYTATAVNPHVWQAALETLYKTDVISADPVSGIIKTDWYLHSTPNMRYKLVVYTFPGKLRASSVKVAAFTQRKERGKWSESLESSAISNTIATQILQRARELKLQP